MNSPQHFQKTASGKKFRVCPVAPEANRPASRAASGVWARRRKNRVGLICYPDHLGTPRAITTSDASNTKVWEWRNDDPFGNNPPNENPSGLGNFTYNLRFPGQIADQETGTFYNWMRDYDPATGRYPQSDPIGLAGGINTYSYGMGNPILYVDTDGLEVEVGVRRFYPVPVPYARHCFLRFNKNNNDTLSFSNQGVNPDPNPGGANYSPTKGKENDECVKQEMKKCTADDYDFTEFNCCKCTSNALNACGLVKEGAWPNAPYDAGKPPYTPKPKKPKPEKKKTEEKKK